MTPTCPNCGNNEPDMIERLPLQTPRYYCKVCSKEFIVEKA